MQNNEQCAHRLTRQTDMDLTYFFVDFRQIRQTHHKKEGVSGSTQREKRQLQREREKTKITGYSAQRGAPLAQCAGPRAREMRVFLDQRAGDKKGGTICIAAGVPAEGEFAFVS